MKQTNSGISLIEITITLAISSLLIMNIAIPGIKQIFDKVAADNVLRNVDTAIQMARQTAITENIMVTYCRSDNGTHCQGKWSEGSIIFTDNNADHILNENDRLIYRFNPMRAKGNLKFKSFGNKQYLQITPRGFTNYQNGNFTYCPINNDAKLARQLIVNLGARTRLARDIDNDGVVEDSQGKPVSCK